MAMDTAGRAVLFAGTTVVISLMGMLIMQLSFVSGLAIGMAVVVAMTLVASLTLLPALLGFAGERIEVTRRRGLIAAGLVAVALIGVGARHARPDRWSRCPWPIIVLLASLAVRPAAQAGARARAQAAAGDALLPLEPSDPAPAVARRHPRHRVLARPGPARSSACASASPTRATTPRTPPPARPTTCWPRASGPGSTAPLVLASEVPAGHRPRRPAGGVRRHPGRPGRRVRQPADHQRRGDPTAALWRVIPTTAPQDAETTDLVNRLRTTSSRPPPRAPGSTWRWPAASPSASTSPSTWRPGCRGSSPPCSACRSCC